MEEKIYQVIALGVEPRFDSQASMTAMLMDANCYFFPLILKKRPVLYYSNSGRIAHQHFIHVDLVIKVDKAAVLEGPKR